MTLNMKYLQHSCIAIAIQSIIAVATGDWWHGAFAGSFYFIGREYAQAEHRNILQNYSGKRANMPFWGGMQPRAWTIKGIFDFVLPTISVVTVALVFNKKIIS